MSDETQTEQAALLRKAMRSLREELKITQMQLAMAVELAPNSIYRYESGDSFPDGGGLIVLWDFALRNGSHAAVYFSELIESRFPRMQGILDGFAKKSTPGAEDLLKHSARKKLRTADRILVMALEKMLLSEPSARDLRLINTLLEPWIEATKNEVSQRIHERAFVDDAESTPTVEHSKVAAEQRRARKKQK